ncbi:MAG: aminotransferase [Beijerinckiaceae bacterium]
MLTNLQTRDIETLIHPYTQLAAHREAGPLVLERGKGVFVYDTAGKEYIEGMAGLWCASLGYGHEEVIDAATEQLKKLSYTHLFSGRSHDPAIEVAEKLKEIAPVPISKVFFTCSGSEANDSQMKLIWYMNNALGRPKKKKIIARLKGYHGVTIASASLTGLPNNHIDFDLPIANVLHTSCPHHYRFAEPGESEEQYSQRLAAEIEDMILREGPDTVAAFIAEPVLGAGGAIMHPRGYFAAVQAVLDKYDVRLIADEVITAFGRTGNMFGSTTLGMKPHTISVAKAITSAYMPLGAVLIDEPMYQAMLDESRKIGTFGHGFTYSGHPVACAVAMKVLDIYERENIVAAVQKKSPTFVKRLEGLIEHPLVGEAKALGLIGGIELVADKPTKKSFDPKKGVAAKCVGFAQAEGLIVRPLGGDRVAFCPPLVISEAEINEMFDRFERALAKTADWVTATA